MDVHDGPARTSSLQRFVLRFAFVPSPVQSTPHMASTDPRVVLANAPMGFVQVRVIAILICMNALDGFDVLAISFAAPGIADEWGISRAKLGFVLSMELIGMGIGSLTLGGLADTIGRRRSVLTCLTLMATGMTLAITARSVEALSFWRVLTGLGIGGMLACANATAAEFANDRRRHLCVSWVAIGYPLGAVVSGTIAAVLLNYFEWRSVFVVGAALTVVFVPLVYLFVPESVVWLCQKQPQGALARVNATLTRMGHATVDALPEREADFATQTPADIFSPRLLPRTLLATSAYFLHLVTLYFLLKWTPKLVVDMGHSASAAAGVLVWTNVGGVFGGFVLGLIAQRLGLKRPIVLATLLSAACVALFGSAGDDLPTLMAICTVGGFALSSGGIGMLATFAQTFPTHVRAFGTGFGIGVGRTGAIVAPILAGFLFDAGFKLPAVAALMAGGSFLAALCILSLNYRRE